MVEQKYASFQLEVDYRSNRQKATTREKQKMNSLDLKCQLTASVKKKKKKERFYMLYMYMLYIVLAIVSIFHELILKCPCLTIFKLTVL